MALMTALSVGSALVSAYGQYQSSQAQAEQQRQQSQIDFARAEEILRRNEINNELLMESALVHTGTQKAQAAGAGVDVSGIGRLVQDTVNKAIEQIELDTRAAEWESRMVRLGAETRLETASDIESAGTISAIGKAGFGIGTAFHNSPGGDKNG